MSLTSLLLVPWILLPGGARCPHQQDKQPEAKVKVTVVVILASDRCPYIHPRLQEIAAEFQKGDPSMTGFMLVSMTEQSLPANKKFKFACVEGCCVEVVIHRCADEANKVCLAVTAPLQDEILYRCVCGKFFPIVTRYRIRERIPPHYVGRAICHLCGGNAAQRMLALETLLHGRCCDLLILAIRVQPCKEK
jgi:hypothetical protein